MTSRTTAVLAAGALLVGGCDRSGERGAVSSTQGAATHADSHADSLLARGQRLFAAEKYDSARTTWTIALRETQATHDSSAQARALLALAAVAWQVGEAGEAKGLGEEALALITARKMTAELSSAYRILGLAALGMSRNRDAAALFQRALDAARVVKNGSDELRAAGNMGLAYGYMGDNVRARAAHRDARAAARLLGDARLEGKGLANEAMVDIGEGYARPAIARLDSARSLYRQSHFETGEQQALGQLATAYELTGEEHKSFALLDSALRIARRLGLVDEEVDDLRLIAGLHLRLGDARRALDAYRDTEARMRKAGLTANLGSLLRSSAETNLRLGDVPRASIQMEEALALHTAAEEPSERLADELLGAELDQHVGRMDRVESRMRVARDIAGTLNTRGARISVALADAHLADLAGEARRVLRVLRDASPDMIAGDYGAEWMADALASRAYAKLGNLDSAVNVGRRAVFAVERLRGALASEALKSAFVVDRASVYGDLVLALLRLGRTEEAFVVADAARSRGLLGRLSAARSDLPTSGGPTDLVEGERLLRRIDDLVQKLRTTERQLPRERGVPVDDAGAAIVDELTSTRSRYEALMVRAGETQAHASAILGARPARLAEVRAALQPHEALLEYMLAGRTLVTFVVTRDTLSVVQHEINREALTQRVWLLRDLWGRPGSDWRAGMAASRALHASLVTPLENAGLLQQVQRLIIVPHGVLSQVPFAALANAKNGQFLVQQFEIVHLPSAGSLSATRTGQRDIGPLSAEGIGFAPFPKELAATVTEVAAFRASGAGRTILTGSEATEAAVRRALAGTGVVHVATHGVFNARNPMFSRLEFARPAVSSAENDGRLEVHEILALSIRSSLAFLSGCETGTGQEWGDDPVRGTGDLTLAQAVLAAGASNVVMTLWRLDDAGAAEFAGRFYRRLQSSSVSAALASAQRETAADSRYASPYYWAGYTLSGDGARRVSPQVATSASVSNATMVSVIGASGSITPLRNRP